MNTSQRKQAEAHEREAAVDEIENEISMLTKSHQETRDRIKSLKASKKTYIHKQNSSSKAESNSSGRVHTTMNSSSENVKKVTTAAKVGSKKCKLSFLSVFHLILTTTPAKIKLRKDSSSLTASLTATQAASSDSESTPSPQAADLNMAWNSETDVLQAECGEVLPMDWVNGAGGLVLSGACFLNITVI